MRLLVGFRDLEVRTVEVPIDPVTTFVEASGNGNLSRKIPLHCRCQLSQPCEEHQTRHGFYVHALCWDMIKGVVGPQAGQEDDRLVQAMRRVWKIIPGQTIRSQVPRENCVAKRLPLERGYTKCRI
jgi:hypothetical protein